MMGWLILVLFIPTVLAPVVLLWGFAGCNPIFGLDPTTLVVEPPIDFKVTAIDINAIRLSWTNQEAMSTIEIRRTKEGGFPEEPFDVGSVSTFNDSNLEIGTRYFYEARAVRPSDNAHSDWVSDENSNAATFIFNGQLDPAAGQGSDQGNLQGFCIVTRIPAVTPAPNGRFWPRISISLRGSTAGALTLDKVTISLPADINPALPPTQRERWDSHTDLMLIASGVSLAPGMSQAVIADYPLDGSQDLLIAFDLNAAAGMGEGRFGPLFLAGPPRSHAKGPPAVGAATAQAMTTNRTSDFQPSPAHYFVDKIEVA